MSAHGGSPVPGPTRGLPGGSSIAKLLAEQRGVRNSRDLPPLTERQILRWADAYRKQHGRWPQCHSGLIAGTTEKWGRVDAALREGERGLPGGSSLARLLAEKRGMRNRSDLPALSERQILKWADAYQKQHGRWPNVSSGQIPSTDDTWKSVNRGLVRGLRGLPGGSSLAKLLAKRRGARNPASPQC